MAKPGGGAAAAEAATAAGEPLLLPQQHHQPPLPAYYGVPVGGYPAPPPPQPYVVLLPFRRRRHQGRCSCCNSLLSSSSLLALFSAALLLGAAGFFLWPSDPEVRLSRLSLRSIHFSTGKRGTLTLDVDVDLKIRVVNRDFFSLDYDEIRVGIGYRGRSLGSVKAGGGHLRARGVSYVDARLRLDGIRVFEDVFFLIEDLARGSVPFDTTTELRSGQLHLFGIDVPLEGRVSCSINVDVGNQRIASQDCYAD
ncbi:unnamed protein product [Spirodela intermedia]|uniref:Late embryogenesis abundant protein LEA-2 subgroup domain-containing protein n=1 Tax=Spirodela intermedia TaxID=51605 RepID=A0A7I8LE58_SPIIN|nr:unnamed protein product [Spirodela intermedia]